VIKKSIRILCMLGGLALTGYGITLIFSLERLSFEKLTYEGRDTYSAVLVSVIGMTLFLYGFLSCDSD